METAEIVSKVKEIVDPLAADQGALVENVTYNPGSNPPALAIIVDRTDGIESLSSDQVANLARLFSKALDAADPIADQYNLEVSTPGAESALTTDRQYRRNVGRTIRVRLRDGDKLEGALANVTDDGVVLDVDGKKNSYPFDKIRSARVIAQVPTEG